MDSKNIGHREARTIALRVFTTMLYTTKLYGLANYIVLVFVIIELIENIGHRLAIERLELLILTFLTQCSNQWTIMPCTSLCFWFLVIFNGKMYKWLFKKMAIEKLELSILATSARRSNRLSYLVLFLTVGCSYSNQSFSNSYWIALRKNFTLL